MNDQNLTQIISNPNKIQKKVTFFKLNVLNDDGEEYDIIPVYVDKEFGLQIQQARIKLKMTQKDLSNAVNLPLSVISSYENGKGGRNGCYVNIIKKYLNIHK